MNAIELAEQTIAAAEKSGLHKDALRLGDFLQGYNDGVVSHLVLLAQTAVLRKKLSTISSGLMPN